MDVFVYLADHANELVSRDQLLDSIWSEHVAADELLTGAISDLRRALQDDKGGLKYIETIPKRGYRLIGGVRPLRQRKTSWAVGIALATTLTVLAVSGIGWLLDSAVPGPITSIAVLPLDNLSGEPEQEYFTDGMTEALVAELGQIKALRVISRTSSEQFKDTDKLLPEIAHELGVDALVEGSVLLAGDEVRITLQLVHGPTDQHLWSRHFQRDLRDVLALQREVAQTIAEEIRMTLTPQEQSRLAEASVVDPETYTLCLKGNFHLTRSSEESFRKALALYQQAIDRDPDYAPAYAGQAMAYAGLGGWFSSESPRDNARLAKKAAEQALVLDPTLAEAHLALGLIRYQFDWDWAGAERSFKQGIAANPSSTAGRIDYANFLTAMGRFDESVEVGRQTLVIDPLSPVAHNEMAFPLFRLGRDDEAMELVREGLEIDPDSHQTHALLSEFEERRGNFEEALAHMAFLDRFRENLPPATLGIVGRSYALAGRENEARALLSQLMERREREFVPAIAIVYVNLGLGEHDEALKWLEAAYEERDVSLIWLKELWIYDPLRSDPRFQSILERMDFPRQ